MLPSPFCLIRCKSTVKFPVGWRFDVVSRGRGCTFSTGSNVFGSVLKLPVKKLIIAKTIIDRYTHFAYRFQVVYENGKTATLCLDQSVYAVHKYHRRF
jgi:hypothetical protein